MTTWYVDLVGGDNSKNGESFANRKLTIADISAVAGDTIRVMGNASTNSGTATWTNNSNLVTLSSALAPLLYADGAWTTLSTKATCSAVTSSPSPKQGSNCAEMTCASTFTTASAIAYYPTGAALNLSGYQQISLWMQVSAALAASSLRIDLCSDTAGGTVVDSLTITQALNAGSWTNITLNNGAALGSSIQSIRVYALKTVASKKIYIDNVVACAAPSATGCLTLGTLISPDNATWYPVQSIDGTTVYLDGLEITAAQAAGAYQGATGSFPFYMLQPTLSSIAAANTDYVDSSAKNGSAAGGQITFSGGWDSVSMSTQSGWTVLDNMDWTQSGIDLTGTTGYLTVDHFVFTRCFAALSLVYTSKGYELSNSTFSGVTSAYPFSNFAEHSMVMASCNFLNSQYSSSSAAAIITVVPSSDYVTDGTASSITNCNVYGCECASGILLYSQGTALGGLSSPGITITGCNSSGNTGYGFAMSGNCGGGFYNNTADNNTSAGFWFEGGFAFDFIAYNLQARGNGSSPVDGEPACQVWISTSTVEIYGLDTNTPGGSALPQIYIGGGSAIVYDWLQYTGTSPAASLYSFSSNLYNVIRSHRENYNRNDNSTYSTFGMITTTGITGEPSSGLAWQLSPNASANSVSPLSLSVGKIFCPAGVTTSISYYAEVTGVGINAQLRIPGGRYAGVGSPGTDVTTAVTATSLSPCTISLTPTQSCVVDVSFDAWGSSTGTATISAPVSISS